MFEEKVLSVNLNDIATNFKKEGLQAFGETVGEYYFTFPNFEDFLRVKVIKTLNGRYRSSTNYKIQTPYPLTSYRGVHDEDTIENVLIEAISGFFFFLNSNKGDKKKPEPNEEY